MGMIEFEDRDEEGRQMLLDWLEGRESCRRRRSAIFIPIAIALGIVALVLIWIFWVR